MHIEQGFQQVPFQEENPYSRDPVLPFLLRRLFPPRLFNEEIEPALEKFGEEVITGIRAQSKGNRISPPELIQYDNWGRRIDELQTSEGWRSLKATAQREGLPGIFYERRYREHSRLFGFAKALMMVGDSYEVFCPLSMTDGAARVLELVGTESMRREIFPRLISRDPSTALVAGQWMTERPGGSDVSQTETEAQSLGDGDSLGPRYSLDGFKWFSSATDGDVALALARTGPADRGSRGLSLFLIPLREMSPHLSSSTNGIRVHRLKNKIGTHALPTAELSLEQTTAYLIGTLNEGVKTIVPVLNITRVWSAISSVGALRRCLAIAIAYAEVRKIDGGKRLLKDVPVHVAQLASINLVYRALTHLVFGTVMTLGRVECGTASREEEHRLRMFTPIVKGFAAEKAVTAMEEAMTALGGQGYMEENEIGRLIRDSLVEKIWEGTTTVLSLDLLRSTSEPARLKEFISWSNSIILSCPPSLLKGVQDAIQALQGRLDSLIAAFLHPIPNLIARPSLIFMGYIASAIFLLEHANWSHSRGEDGYEVDAEVFRRWVNDGGFVAAEHELVRIRSEVKIADTSNSTIVFGRKVQTKL
ncbi:acyl-CoA dehydrogenase/oxidase [Lentinula raphanica]|uniref:Acyl-CoA dehydrogenase/oxidase n=1 Tax=Lentinula raphanica TaxID=153919 RepID=A0AA38UKA7_9AGAR|nr:acyl-CoA dehydrogenase/oxidase [Lentinula raphanica]KAJ3841652.1 acyl-CoA dehydrogenase/oxidase [Lentinula raphanica]